MNEDILSFLFKYPISKLTAAESAQVEMLITTLITQKPVLRASDIFTVGTRLLAAVYLWNSCDLRTRSSTIPSVLDEINQQKQKMYISTEHMMLDAVKQVEKEPPKSKNKICFCKSISPVLTVCRFVGIFPGTWTHKDGNCVYEKSWFWMTYSIFIYMLYIFQLLQSVDFPKLTSRKSLPIFLDDITDAIYGIYVIILAVTCFVRFPKWLTTLNKLTVLLKDGLYCQSAKQVVLKLQYCFVCTQILALTLLSSVLAYLHYSDHYKTNFDFRILINKGIQIVPFVLYLQFFTIVAVFIGVLGCFEKLTMSCLKYTPVHPMKGIDESNNVKDFFGFINYEVCKQKHLCNGRLLKLPPPQVVEHLRILHEEISLSTYDMNSCFNPQFLIHAVVELTVLIITWYAVIAYIAYDFKSPYAKTIQILNCGFVTMHTLGLFLFLKNAQELKNMVRI
ncbi:unnamed protein product [Brassicogethes aeneus]|uniref:Gustatory receptor n=1 Tax=Brassicogethes aeneus TaxID=1431903 RepID=A0A9P0F828_BRAAE|nr:unnamed protein product [Brassicogethes aeneus]